MRKSLGTAFISRVINSFVEMQLMPFLQPILIR
jgi:hypothetical protein